MGFGHQQRRVSEIRPKRASSLFTSFGNIYYEAIRPLNISFTLFAACVIISTRYTFYLTYLTG